MSWYFFGGFSAYAIVPSGRWWNHSGCFCTQGWSGEHCSAKSSATSRPQLARPGARSGRSPRACPGPGGRRRGRPPGSRSPRARPTSSRAGGQGVVAALAEGGADRVDRRQVDDVEAHRGDRRQPPRRPCGTCRCGAASRRCPRSAGRTRTRTRTAPAPAPPAAAAARDGGDQLAQRMPAPAPRPPPGSGPPRAGRRPGGASSRRASTAAEHRRRGPSLFGTPAAARSYSSGALLQDQLGVDARPGS